MDRLKELEAVIKDIDDSEKKLIKPLLEEIVNLENQMQELKKLPFIKINPNDPTMQKVTPASKLYKECSQSYMNAIRIMINVLRKQDSEELNLLLKKLEEFD